MISWPAPVSFLVSVFVSSGGPQGQQEKSQITALLILTKRIDVNLQQPLSIFVAMHAIVQFVANQVD
jgi:hypothetical protein